MQDQPTEPPLDSAEESRENKLPDLGVAVGPQPSGFATPDGLPRSAKSVTNDRASPNVVSDEAVPLRPLSVEPLHWTLLAVSAAVIAAASLLTVRGEEQVVIPIIQLPLPGTCTFKTYIGYDCPGCGLTRCFVSLGHGDIRRAWSFNPVGIFLFAVVVSQIPYRLLQIGRLRCRLQPVRLPAWTNLVLAGVAVALLLQWVGRWIFGDL